MRCVPLAVQALAAYFLLAGAGQTEEPAAKLPDDGWWARYYVTMKMSYPLPWHP